MVYSTLGKKKKKKNPEGKLGKSHFTEYYFTYDVRKNRRQETLPLAPAYLPRSYFKM